MKDVIDEAGVRKLAKELKFNLDDEGIKEVASYINGLGEFLEPILNTKEDKVATSAVMESFEEATLREDVPKQSEIHPADNAPAFEINHFVVPLVK